MYTHTVTIRGGVPQIIFCECSQDAEEEATVARQHGFEVTVTELERPTK